MRGLYSISDIASVDLNIWDSEGFVSFLICLPTHESYIQALKKNWVWIDSAMGGSLWVLVSFVDGDASISDQEALASVKNVNDLGLKFDQTPCLIFARDHSSTEYFEFPLDPGATEKEAIKTFLRVVDACRKHMPTESSGRTDHGFNALCQELNGLTNEKHVKVALGVVGDVMLTALKKLATRGI